MILVAWLLFALVALYIICSCIRACVKMITKEKPKKLIAARPKQDTAGEMIESMFGKNIDILLKYNGLTFWTYSDNNLYFTRDHYNKREVINKIANKCDDLMKKYSDTTDYFLTMNESDDGHTLSWEFNPIDFSRYSIPKSPKDICIDELDKLIDDK